MEKMKAKVIKKKVTKYFVEVDTGTEKLLVGEDIGGFCKYCEWDKRQDAVDYIKSKEQLEFVVNPDLVK
ncbi:hypothetical protein [Terrisporobacter mayombei]|uniref:Uncharacterized protein n=1 Tax=Terrisporobacter mayombei TaxID=1541 RepID=A0ABY9PWY2_9FIRM|nr:hypothetical protein [Terrisporobacter mayombei]MCC3870263.1 hypothetical protein [Terrisporobacter mayombei]WMT79889.1 hypothetical protein TEMA_01600 [Terrisporobacter mayombei]